jgi:hypothetical protein
MVLVIVIPLLRHSLLTLPFIVKLTLVTVSPTIVTMELHDLRLGLGMGLLTWFLSTRLLHRFSSLGFSLSFPKNTFPKVLMNLIGFWKSFVE